MVFDAIQEWFQELLIDGIIANLTGMFDTLNTKVGEIAGEVGMSPSTWDSGIFNMIRSLSETVIIPIAGIVLTFVMCYELIQLIIEKNNLHDFDTWIFFKWIFKTFCAVLIVTNTWNIVMAVFDVAQNVVSQSAGVIITDAGIDISSVTNNLETELADWSIGALLGLWFQSTLPQGALRRLFLHLLQQLFHGLLEYVCGHLACLHCKGDGALGDFFLHAITSVPGCRTVYGWREKRSSCPSWWGRYTERPASIS